MEVEIEDVNDDRTNVLEEIRMDRDAKTGARICAELKTEIKILCFNILKMHVQHVDLFIYLFIYFVFELFEGIILDVI